MKMGLMGAMHKAPCATALPPRHVRAGAIRCSFSSGHVSFIKDIAATNPPEHLDELLKVLQVTPLFLQDLGVAIALLRWPTAPPGKVDQYIHHIVVEEDSHHVEENSGELFHTSSEAGKKLYQRGDFTESQITSLDGYILSKVGLFPDILECKMRQHFEEGDHEVAGIAQWEDEQIEYIKEKVTEEGRQEDLNKGKSPLQIALDEVAYLLDLASVEGTWPDYLEPVAECYEAGLDKIARFILYTD